MILGLFLMILGLLLLLRNLGLITLPASVWSVLYPIILVLLGIWIMALVQRGRHYKHWMMNRYWGRRDDNEV